MEGRHPVVYLAVERSLAGTWHDSAARDGAALSGDQAELRARVTASVRWPRRACPAGG